jgi:hypothetical protein
MQGIAHSTFTPRLIAANRACKVNGIAASAKLSHVPKLG